MAIGGPGKSAITWTWFNDIAPQEADWSGRVWWSFHESDASSESLVTRTLAYVNGQPVNALKKTPHREREDTLLHALSQAPYLLEERGDYVPLPGAEGFGGTDAPVLPR